MQGVNALSRAWSFCRFYSVVERGQVVDGLVDVTCRGVEEPRILVNWSREALI